MQKSDLMETYVEDCTNFLSSAEPNTEKSFFLDFLTRNFSVWIGTDLNRGATHRSALFEYS